MIPLRASRARTERGAGTAPPRCRTHSSKLNIFVTFKGNYVYLMKKVNEGPVPVFCVITSSIPAGIPLCPRETYRTAKARQTLPIPLYPIIISWRNLHLNDCFFQSTS